MEYTISRFEEKGDSLFICINSKNNPVYIEHFWQEDEKLDVKGTIEKLVAQLEIMDSNYVAPLPTVDKLEEIATIKLDSKKIASEKASLLAKEIEDESINTKE